MAVPAYTTDLTTIVDFDGTSGTAAEPTTGWIAGRSPVNNDTDFPIQSSTHASLTMNATGKAGILVTGSSFTWTSGDYLFAWLIWLAPGAIATRANGGLALLCGDSTSAYKVFYVGGNDFGSYPYGGWQNFAVDPTMTYDEIFGAPSNYYVVGAGANVLSAVSKGNPLGFDAIRYGRGQIRIAGGSSGDGYATFSGMAAANDASAARWGLFQAIEGGYKFKGLMYFGYGALTEFIDSNKSIVIDNTLYVAANFNRIEIHNSSSVINWTNISITALGTVSKGQFEVIDNANVALTDCTFTDMSTFVFLSNSVLTNCTWRRCGQITQSTGSFDECLITNSTAAVAMLCSNVGNLTNCEFVSAGTGHGIELDSNHSGNDYDLNNIVFTNYGSDGTANACIKNNSGGHVNLTVIGGTTPTVLNVGASTTTVILPEYTFTVKGLEYGTEVTIVTAGTTTVLSHTESATVSDGEGKYKATYSHSGGATVDVLVFHTDYQPDVSNIYSLTLPSANSEAKVQMFTDLNYFNP